MDVTFTALAPIAVAAGLLVAGFFLGVLIRGAVLPRLPIAWRQWLRGPVLWWSTLLGLYVAVEVTVLPAGVGPVLRKVLLVLLILSVTAALARAVTALVTARGAILGTVPAVRLVSNVAGLVAWILGGLVILQTLGISITPMITALGIGGLAVGLALQDTLANLFAGVHILAARQVRPGDYIRLESGEEGFVRDITWRYTTVVQLANNLTIVPNAKLASAVITNYYLPSTDLAVLVPVGVSYGSDLTRVEAVTTAVGREVMGEVHGGVPEFEPFIRYNAFADSSVNFTVILRGREVVDQHLIRHEFIKRLHARYRAEGIEIPFPQRTVHVRGEEIRTPGPSAGTSESPS
ncbi:MAG TPA: mechanosensitive ion channel family protein [Gemmatimonadales bacterium]|nr:mechanosensitive ion channel family protein [Gemmatimonadales bacterium]